MKKIILSLHLLSLIFLDAKSLSFQHHDWQVVCDNTHTCRIAGYSSDESKENRVSILFTRKAGQGEPIRGEVQLASAYVEDTKLFQELPSLFKLELLIDNKSYGFVSMDKAKLVAPLSQRQIEGLLRALRKSSSIVWKYKKTTWKLSDEGSSAVLLKADEFQKRIGTRGAFFKKGKKGEEGVLKAKPLPILKVQDIENDKEIVLKESFVKKLDDLLSLGEEECWVDDEEDNNLVFYKLSSTKILASRLCWRAAYNAGSAYWVINSKPPFNPDLITSNGTAYYVDKHMGTISENQKGRGIGDCWSYSSYAWTGKIFELSSEGTTGLCRVIAGGGAWQLPTFVSSVK